MKNETFKNISEKTQDVVQSTANLIKSKNILEERKQIEDTSPYSNNINKHISSFEELQCYCALHLQEARVTRLALIQTINPTLWIACKNKTNLELMLSGNAPFAYDSPDGMIELHHIGQSSEAPFAELTVKDHLLHGNHKLLHISSSESWRTEPKEELRFSKERATYWRQRGNGDYEILTSNSIVPINAYLKERSETDFLLINEAVEKLYAECTPQELSYLSDLANSYAIIKEFGYDSTVEFIEKCRQDSMCTLSVQCRVCGSKDYNRYGYQKHNSEKIPRYKCKNCGKIFTSIDHSIISGCKFSLLEWLKFINCLYNGLSLEATAKQCHVSVQCVHENRLKLFYALTLMDEQTKLKGNIVLDETYFPVSFKGAGTPQSKSLMKRKPHKRGSENHTKGLSQNLVCVVCAIDEYGNAIARIAGLGAPNAERIQKALGDAIDINTVTCIYSDKSAALRRYAENIGIPIKQTVASISRRKHPKKYGNTSEKAIILRQIQKINSFHSKLHRFLSNFMGVSSHLLNGYLRLFLWKERHYHAFPSVPYQELLKVLLQPGLYKSSEDILQMAYFREVTNRIQTEYFKDMERAKAIYARYAQGEAIQTIADAYHITKSAVQYVIRKLKKTGLAYKTKMDTLAEEKAQKEKRIPYSYKTIQRNQCIYLQKTEWTGSSCDFYAWASNEYRLSSQTVKNIIALEERILALKESFFIYQNFAYRTLQEVYMAVYERYLELLDLKFRSMQCIQILKHEFQYSEISIFKILQMMRENIDNTKFFSKKKKMAITETLVRDRALFVDFLKWDGSKKDFCVWASEKYQLSFHYIYHILSLNFMADPKRYENTYQRPTQHKESQEEKKER